MRKPRPELNVLVGDDPRTGQPVRYGFERGLVTIAPPGSGKTQCHILPNLLTWQWPAIVLDVTGELWAETSEWRSRNVGPVYKIDLDHPDESDHYNPFDFIRRDLDHVWGDAQTFAALLYTRQSVSNDGGSFYDLASQQYLAALACFTALYHDAPERNFDTLLSYVSGTTLEGFTAEAATKREVPGLVNAAAALRRADDRTKGNVIWTARNCLSPWEDPQTAKISRISDWHPDTIRGQKATLYICLSLEKLATHPGLIRLLVGQHLRAFMRKRVARNAPWVQFFLDETPQLRNLDVLVQAIEAGRNYNLRVWMVMQWKGQLEQAYGEKTANGMIAACGLQAYLNPSLVDGLAEQVSNQIGFDEAIELGQMQRRPKKTPQTLAGPDHEEDVIAFSHGEVHYLRKHFYHDDAALLKRRGKSD